MPNDAKLGLLVGVAGVIAVAVLSANRPPAPAGSAGAVRHDVPVQSVAKPDPEPRTEPEPGRLPELKVEAAASSAPGELPAELASTPVVRPNREPDGTPVGREEKRGERP